MIAIFDGPEKAGKTSIITGVYRSLHEMHINCIIKKWGPVFPDDSVYIEEMKHDAASKLVVLWDRGWPSEHVYAVLMDRNRRLRLYPEIAEESYGRLAKLKFIVLSNPEETMARRDGTDLNTLAIKEYEMFEKYARRFSWSILYNDYTPAALATNILAVSKSIVKEVVS